MKKLANSTKWLLAISGILMIIVGGILIWKPFESAWSVINVVGWALLISAIIEIVASICNYNRFYAGWLFIRGLITGLVGALFAFRSVASTDLLLMIFGLWVIVTGAVQFANSFIVRALGQKEWYWPLIGGIIEIIAGVIAIFNPGLSLVAVAYVLAVSLIVDGVVNLIDAFKIQQGLNEVKRWEKAITKLLTAGN